MYTIAYVKATKTNKILLKINNYLLKSYVCEKCHPNTTKEKNRRCKYCLFLVNRKKSLIYVNLIT